MRIAFWSNVHGQSATTSNMLSIALVTALEYRLKMLITHNHFEKSTIESSLLDKRYLNSELMELSDSGIDALARFIKSNKLDKDNIVNYTTSILKKKLDLLMGTTNTNKDLYMHDLNNVMNQILSLAQEFYDVVFIDVSAGYNELSSKILKYSDIIVVNLSQNSSVLDDFFERHKEGLENYIFLIGRYDMDSRYNTKNIMRRYGIKKNIAAIPYNIEFSDACSDGRVLDFFLKNLSAKKDDLNYCFINEVRNAARLILAHTGIDITTKKIGD